MKAASAVHASTPDRTARLIELLRSRRQLLVLTHNNPDPDSLGSAMGLLDFARKVAGIDGMFAMTGRILRAENREMVRQLGIDPTDAGTLDLTRFDCIALVDTQPGFGHTVVPAGRQVDIVIDHHVGSDDEGVALGAVFTDVRTNVGATSSAVTSYFIDARVVPGRDVATGLLYGIKTDTADLSRNVSDADLRAHEFLFPHVDREKLVAITRPRLTRAYFVTLKEALSKVRIYGNAALCSLGKVAGAEMVAEVADLLLRLEGMQYVFCGGLVDNSYYVSVRTDPKLGDAWRLIRGALEGEEGTFGGHGSVAGGSIHLPDGHARTLKRLERRLERNILRSVGVEGANASALVPDDD